MDTTLIDKNILIDKIVNHRKAFLNYSSGGGSQIYDLTVSVVLQKQGTSEPYSDNTSLKKLLERLEVESLQALIASLEASLASFGKTPWPKV